MVRKSQGRQKVAMAKMTSESNLQVTFSKRRAGLFKKASELCTLCGAEIAIIVFSPGNKAFSFGHPSVESIIDRFLNRLPNAAAAGTQVSSTFHLVEAHRNASVRELNAQLTQLQDQVEEEKKRGKTLSQMRRAGQIQCWWESPVEELGLQQLEHLKAAMEELKRNVAKHVDKMLVEASNPPAPPAFFGGGSVGVGGLVDVNAGGALGSAAALVPQHYNFGYGRGPSDEMGDGLVRLQYV